MTSIFNWWWIDVELLTSIAEKLSIVINVSAERVISMNYMWWGQWRMIWDNNELLPNRGLWRSFEMNIHTPSLTAARSQLPFLLLSWVFSLCDPAQEKFKGNCLMAQKKVLKVKKEFEDVLMCQKDELCSGKGDAKERGGDAFFVFLESRLP